MTADILCLGEPMMEFNHQPEGHYASGHGGDVSNCAVAAARNGASVGMIAHLGGDPFGDSFIEMWSREGVDASAVERTAAPTGIYFVTHGPGGHEFSYYRAGSAASRMTPDDLPREVISSAKALHVSGISQGISTSAADSVFEAIELARAAGVAVSYDTNLRLKLWPLARARAVIHAAVARCDVALPGLDDAQALTGLENPDAIVEFYLGLGVGIVALTLGKDGVLVATPERRERIGAFLVDAVDATGAGDTFDGAFLAEWTARRDPFAAAHYANAAAALSTLGYGAVAPMPKREAVERFLQERGGARAPS
ncbi:MAG: sugar kinase [Rhodobacteraceae bacterium]|nr:sugar kinase [Paracoccaceae bacterium]